MSGSGSSGGRGTGGGRGTSGGAGRPARLKRPAGIGLIAAVSENGVIGRDGGLPWRLPADLRHFQRLTLGHCLLMGRRTWESIRRPLAGRRMIVVTQRPEYVAEGAEVAPSLRAAIALAAPEEKVWIAGGAGIYREAFEERIGDQLSLTRIHHDFAGDTRFPLFDLNEWELVSAKRHEAGGENPWDYSFLLYERREWPHGGGER